MQYGELRSYRDSRLVSEFVLQVLISQLQGHLQESHYSTSSSRSSSSPTVTSSDDETREREDRIESDTSPVPVSTNVDDRSGQPFVDQANQNPKTP